MIRKVTDRPTRETNKHAWHWRWRWSYEWTKFKCKYTIRKTISYLLAAAMLAICVTVCEVITYELPDELDLNLRPWRLRSRTFTICMKIGRQLNLSTFCVPNMCVSRFMHASFVLGDFLCHTHSQTAPQHFIGCAIASTNLRKA